MSSLLLNKAAEILKAHLVPCLLVGVATWGLFRYTRDRFETSVRDLTTTREIHERQISKILAAQEAERIQHEENLRRLQDTLEAVRADHESKIQALEEKKAKATSRLVQQYGDDPTGMARHLSEVAGFQVYSGESK